MIELTPMGRLFFGAIAVVIIAYIAFAFVPWGQLNLPALSPFGQGPAEGGGIPLVKVFVASYGQDSIAAVSMLREVSRSDEFRGKFDYQIVQVDTSPEQARAFGVSRVPSFIIGSQLYEGPQAKAFIEERLREAIGK